MAINYKELYGYMIILDGEERIGDDPVDTTPVTDVYDPCAPLTDPSNTCGKLAQIEGSGAYTQDTNGSAGASGRYQIEQPTAVGQMKKMGVGQNDTERKALWQKCRNSASAECKKLQDDICNNYAGSMKGKNIREVYLQWNMGPTGAREILDANAGDGQVDNQVRINKMDNQAWTKNNPSNGDTTKFLAGLDNYIQKRGIDPQSTV